LKRLRTPTRRKADHLTIEYQLARWHRKDCLHNFRRCRCNVVQRPRIDPHLATASMHLDSRPIELVLQRCLAHFLQSRIGIRSRLRQHRMHRLEHLNVVIRQRRFAELE
jgi:hypothetical protein